MPCSCHRPRALYLCGLHSHGLIPERRPSICDQVSSHHRCCLTLLLLSPWAGFPCRATFGTFINGLRIPALRWFPWIFNWDCSASSPAENFGHSQLNVWNAVGLELWLCTKLQSSVLSHLSFCHCPHNRIFSRSGTILSPLRAFPKLVWVWVLYTCIPVVKVGVTVHA